MGKKKKINTKVVIAFIILLTISILMYFFPVSGKDLLKQFLSAKITYYLICAITVIIYVLYFFFSKDKNYNLKPIITPLFGHFFDIFMGGIGVAIAISSALTLIKGFYLQQTYEIIYYAEFDNIDQWTIFVTMLFLLYFFVMKVVEVVKELIWVERTSIVS
jgi:membrane protease YdiL (CAAX protease family)